jgi:hypothetical protein
VQVCKLADVLDNLLDLEALPPERRGQSARRAQYYFDVLRHVAAEEARRPIALVGDVLRHVRQALDQRGA